MSRIQLICQMCWRQVEQGHLGVDTVALTTYREALKEWQDNHPDGADLMDLVMGGPELVKWAIHCEECESNACGYCIASGQLRTYKDLVRWTAHLMEKSWLADTDWRFLLQDVAAGKDRRIREVAS